MRVNVIKGGTGLCGSQAFSVILDHYLDGLMKAYQGQCGPHITRYALNTQLHDYIARGGHVHVAAGPEHRVLGWASILIHPSNQLLENVYLVERIIIDEALENEEQCQVTRALIASLIADADATLNKRIDDAWIMVTIPVASIESSQTLFTELASAGFTGSEKAGLTTFILWRDRSAIASSQTAA